MRGLFGLIIGSSDGGFGDDFWVFSTVGGSVDGLCLCVCGFVVDGLWLKWLVLLGFRWVFYFYFFPSVVTLVFLFIYL